MRRDRKNKEYNYLYQEPFGHHVWSKTIGGVWLSLVKAILDCNRVSFDEGRERIDLQNVRIKSDTQILPDKDILKYGEKDNLNHLLQLTFEQKEMFDFDIVPNFSPGADSYYKRITDARMIDFVIRRLSAFPESKKAVMVFPNKNDYQAVLSAPKDDYFPCIINVQFRLVDFIENGCERKPINGYILNTTFSARSIDAFQKSYGNFWAIAQLSGIVAAELSKNLKKKISVGPLDGLITDAHIYKECLVEAKNVIRKWQR